MPNEAAYSPEEVAEAGSSFDFRTLYYALVEKVWLIALCVAAAGFLTVGYLKRCPQVYAATVVLQVEQEKAKILGNAPDVNPEDLRSPEILKTIEKILQSRALFERVIATNSLDHDPRFLGKPDATLTMEQMAGRLASMVRVSLQPGTRLINVTVQDSDAALTEQLANSLVSEFMLYDFEKHFSASEAIGRGLWEKAEYWRKKWEESQARLQAFVKAKRGVSLQERDDIISQKLQELNRNVTAAENQRITLEADYLQVQQKKSDLRGLLSVRSIAQDATVSDLQTRLAQQNVEIENLKKRYLPKHPKWIAARSQLAALEQELTNAVRQAADTVENAYKSAKESEAKLRKLLDEQQTLVMELREQAVTYQDLLAAAQSDREMYDAAVKRVKEIEMGKEWEQSKVRVIQPAYKPEKPIKPNKKRILIMGLMAGLMTGVLLALALETLDASFKTADQVETALNLPILTVVPRVRSVQAGHGSLVMTREKEAVAAEAFRTLRTSLAMLGPEGSRRTFLFTSALPDEGKTFCALNFAYCLAQQGLRTLLVEADLRCPTLERAFEQEEPSAPGLSDYLLQPRDLLAFVQASELENLCCLMAGRPVPQPAELLARAGFDALLKEALLHFDRIVVDSAPIHPVSDTLLLVQRVQTVCLVVRAHKTPRPPVHRAVQALLRAGAPVAGVIVNQLAGTRGEYYYDYSYYPEYVKEPAARA